ncbi:MAG: DUF4080 domain-containing protein, partial [bacterium]|nr:DUF4080 domain-containing protein [bacterium]
GCLFNCSYCLSSCSDQKLEYRDLETVKKELLQLIAIKPKIVKMVDRTFNSNKKFAREIWQFIIDQNSPVPFHFELHPAFLEEADYNILKKAPNNLFHFEVGIQSTDKEVLKAVDRPFNWNIEKGNIEKLCSIKNIHTHLDQIVALPCDNRKTAINSFNEILSLKPDEFQLGFLKVLPGTKLASTCSENSLTVNPFPPYEVIETASMDFKTIKEFYAIERTLNRFYNSHFFKTTLGFLLGQDITPWEFFSILTEMAPDDQAVKRWPVLGETLLNYGRKYLPEDSDYIKDLLKYDWCPYAPAQTYPPFLRENDGDKIKDSRRTAFDYFSGNYEDFKRSEFNRSILYIPDTERFAKKLGDKAILFYRGHNKKELEIDLSVLNS